MIRHSDIGTNRRESKSQDENNLPLYPQEQAGELLFFPKSLIALKRRGFHIDLEHRGGATDFITYHQ
jgi:hypothetical protein